MNCLNLQLLILPISLFIYRAEAVDIAINSHDYGYWVEDLIDEDLLDSLSYETGNIPAHAPF